MIFYVFFQKKLSGKSTDFHYNIRNLFLIYYQQNVIN